MKLSNIFEQNPAMAAAMGANALKKTMGANTSGAMVSKALGKLDQGAVLSPTLAKALSPYADALEKILSNPQFRNRFMQMMKQIQAADKQQEPAQDGQQESVTEDWGSSDGSILVQSIDDAIAKHGLSPEVIQSAAQELAEFYYDDMGYDSPEEAVDAVIDTWKRRSETGRALAQMFAPVESVQEAEGDKPYICLYVKKGKVLRHECYAPTSYEAAKKAAQHWGLKSTSGVSAHLADDSDDVKEAEEDVVDTVTMDVPLMIRMMEYAREDAQDDIDLHDVAERMIAMSKDGPLSMDDYDSIVRSVEALPAPKEEPVEEGYYAPGPETMPGAVGPQEDTNVSFNQTKNFGDAYVTVNANAKDMEELHRVLKLAGIEIEKSEPSVADAAAALAPHVHADEREEGEPCPQCGSVDCTCPPGECTCGSEEEPKDTTYSTDKQTLINVLRDKLQKRLS